jgi:asparagine synthase (glutamine-hydrolysing)
MFGIVSHKGLAEEYISEVKSKVQAHEYSDINSTANRMGLAYGVSVFENNKISVAADSSIHNIRDLCGNDPADVKNEASLIGSLYLQSGTDVFKQLRGSFAVSIYDKTARALILATDRFGIRPVLYSHDESSVVFGSKINEILLLQDSASDGIDYEALVDYINLSAVPSPKTIYRRIKKLPPGYCLVIDQDQISPQINKYYDIEYRVGKRDEKYLMNSLPAFIEDSVRSVVDYEMMSSKSIGAFLSGGTDSSTIAGMIKKTTGHVKTFSIGFDEPGYNELDYARIAARHFGSEHYEYTVTPDDVLKALDIIIDTFDEPFGNASAIPTYYCALLAKANGVNSLLAGDGGDEVFGGNERYAASHIFDMYYHIPAFLRAGLIEPLLSVAPSFISVVNKGKKYIKRAKIPQPERFFSYNPVNAMGMDHIFSRDLLNNLNGYDNLQWAKELYRSAVADNDLNKLLYIDMKFTITDNDLRKVSTMSEKAGVKVSYPFLDHNLVDFAASMPASMKVKGANLRYIFKKSLINFLPKEVIQKKKHGFGLPIGIWIRTKEKISSFVKDHLLSSSCSIRPYFKKGFIEDLFSQHSLTGSAYYGDIIYLLLILEMWNRKFHLGEGVQYQTERVR